MKLVFSYSKYMSKFEAFSMLFISSNIKPLIFEECFPLLTQSLDDKLLLSFRFFECKPINTPYEKKKDAICLRSKQHLVFSRMTTTKATTYLLPALYDDKHVVCVYIYTLGPKSTKKVKEKNFKN